MIYNLFAIYLVAVFYHYTKVNASTANRIAFQYHQQSHQIYRKISFSLLQGSDVSPENINNESIRHAIDKLVSIIDPTGDNSKLQSSTSSKQSSKVHIIGSGLCQTLLNLPLSTLHILSQADVVLYDSLGLSYEDIVQIVPTHCEVICVGKRGGQPSWKQSEIDDLILEKATESVDIQSSSSDIEQKQSIKGKNIIRLKGGDPFLFGRTRTEIEALRSNNLQYTYTPGISSCIAGPHLGGIPLTDPSLDCQSFGVWSGTDAFGKSWGLDAEVGTTKEWKGVGVDVLVFLMIGRLDKLEALCSLIANGSGDNTEKWNTSTPCAVIQNAGGCAEPSIQRVWRSTLENIVRDIKKEDKTRTSVSPAVFVVGRTAALDLLSQDSQ